MEGWVMEGGLSVRNAKETLNFRGLAAIKTGAAIASMRYMRASPSDGFRLQIKRERWNYHLPQRQPQLSTPTLVQSKRTHHMRRLGS